MARGDRCGDELTGWRRVLASVGVAAGIVLFVAMLASWGFLNAGLTDPVPEGLGTADSSLAATGDGAAAAEGESPQGSAVGTGAAADAGAAAGAGGAAASGDAATSDNAAADKGGVRSLTDSAGRTVEVSGAPAHVAVMDPFSAEVAIMVGAGPSLAGMPGGVKSDRILEDIFPQMGKTLTLSGNAVNIETLVEAGCDAAIVKDTMSDEELKKLDRMGIPYVKVAYGDFESQMTALRLVGQLFGGDAATRAEALAGYYEQVAARVAERVAGVPEEERVRVYHSINDALLTDGAGSIGVDWVQRAGCVNVSAEAAPTSGTDAQVSLETVYSWRPQLVVCGTAATAEAIRADLAWAQLDAVVADRVSVLPIGATRWGHRGSAETALAMLWLASEAYPDRVKPEEVRAEVVSYYRDYLGIEVDDSLYGKIMAGEGIRSTGNGNGGGM